MNKLDALFILTSPDHVSQAHSAPCNTFVRLVRYQHDHGKVQEIACQKLENGSLNCGRTTFFMLLHTILFTLANSFFHDLATACPQFNHLHPSCGPLYAPFAFVFHSYTDVYLPSYCMPCLLSHLSYGPLPVALCLILVLHTLSFHPRLQVFHLLHIEIQIMLGPGFVLHLCLYASAANLLFICLLPLHLLHKLSTCICLIRLPWMIG